MEALLLVLAVGLLIIATAFGTLIVSELVQNAIEKSNQDTMWRANKVERLIKNNIEISKDFSVVNNRLVKEVVLEVKQRNWNELEKHLVKLTKERPELIVGALEDLYESFEFDKKE